MRYRASSYANDVWDTFIFEKNLQGDIVAVYGEDGTLLITYTYTAWGLTFPTYRNNGGSTAAVNNPFRYRGYYYEKDLGLYYLNSRYYDQYVGRFISADNVSVLTATPMSLTDKNLYAYCDNNPVMRVDGDGEFWTFVIKATIGSAINIVTGYIAAKITGQDYTWKDVGQAIVSGTLNAIPVVGIASSAIFEGTVTAHSNYKKGASVSASIATGILAGSLNAASIGNLSKLGDSAKEIVVTSFADLVFGTGYSCISSAVSKAVVEKTHRNNLNSVPNLNLQNRAMQR